MGSGLAWEGMPVYPGSGEDEFARDLLPGHYAHFRADLLITLLDVWVLEPPKLGGMKILHWMPVDAAPLSSLDRQLLAGTPGLAVAMSRFGERQILDAGFDCAYAPHSLDMRVWSPLEDREAARNQLGWDGKFVIGLNAANQDADRKGFYEQIAAFGEFSRRHDEARMLIHTRLSTRQGADIQAMIAQEGVVGKALPGDQYAIAAGLVGEAQMASWHGVMDLCSNCSWGEGFGLPVLQSQATGVPVVVTDYSAMTEMCGAGWKVRGQEKWNRGHSAKWMVPSIPAITAAYEKAYKQAGDLALSEKARRFALKYDADVVYKRYWQPILEKAAS